MKISFILPSYNVDQYIGKCIDSIIYQKINDYEIIVVNDASTDNTKQVVEDLILFNSEINIRLINMKTSSGSAGVPRNIGLKYALGEYIAFMDPDDYYIGKNLGLNFEQFDYDLQIYSFISVDEKTELQKIYKLNKGFISKEEDLWSQVLNVCVQRMIFKREFLIDNELRFVERIRGQDLLFLYDVFSKTSNIYLNDLITVAYLEEREASISNVVSKKYVKDSLELLNLLVDKNIDNLSKDELKRLLTIHAYAFYSKLSSRKMYSKEIKKELNKIFKKIK